MSASATLALAAGLAHVAGFVANTTPSLPLGLYRAIDMPLANVPSGAYVRFCPPDTPLFREARRRGYLGAGFCPGGYQTLLKQFVAASGDVVDIGADGVSVNGALLSMSKPLPSDGDGRAMPRYVLRRTLRPDEVLLMSETSQVSFDARYFGPLPRTQIRAVIRPVFTWPAGIASDAIPPSRAY